MLESIHNRQSSFSNSAIIAASLNGADGWNSIESPAHLSRAAERPVCGDTLSGADW
jgi:hypothetical protein